MTDIGKIPPQALEIEQALLGALLLEGSKIENVKELISSDVFYKKANQDIFNAVSEVSKRGKVDILTVTRYLMDNDQIESVGGASYISQLTSKVASAANVKFHAAIIYEKFIAREIIRVCSEMIEKSYSNDNILEVAQDLRNSMDKRILHFLGVNSTGVSIVEAGEKSIEDYYIREKNIREGVIVGIPTTFSQLNKMTGGMQPEQLIVLAGRPGMGKTSVAMSFMLTAARNEKKCAFFSFEMTSARLMDKVICSLSDINHADFKHGRLTDAQKKSMEQSMRIIEKMNVTFNDDMIANVEQVHAIAKSIKDREGLDVVFIDYLQLMKTNEKTGNREQEISTMSRKCKMIAVDLNIPVVLLSQLNRGLESRTNKEPMLSDLRESGAIEQDADIVLFVYRDAVYNELSPEDEGRIIIAKHREGSTGYCEFKHNESLTKFWDYNSETGHESAAFDFIKESKELPF